MSVAYTNHIGRSSRDKHSGKNTAISSIGDLAATEKHNNHDYTVEDVSRMQSAIDLDLRDLNTHYEMQDGELVKIEGHLDLEANVRKIYEEQFTEVIAEYNEQQISANHPERQIESYIDKLSEDKKHEIAVEGLIQFGSLEDWENKSLEDRNKVVPLLLQCLKDTLSELKGTNREFILAGASIHLNEGSPHLHYVGVPVQKAPEAKKGMKKRVKKSAVFTKYTLGTGLQDNVRAKIAPMVKEVFGWDFDEKKTGRNEDREKNVHVNEKLKEEIRTNKQILQEQEQLKEQISKESKEIIDEYKVEAAELQEEIEELLEDKYLIKNFEEYDFAVTDIDRTIEKWAYNLQDVINIAAEEKLSPKGLDRLLQSLLRSIKNAIEVLYKRIEGIKLFERLNKLVPPNGKRQQENLDEIIAGAREKRDAQIEPRTNRNRKEQDRI